MIRRPVARTVGRTAVIAGTATAVSGRVAQRQQARYAEEVPAQTPPAPPAPETTDGPSSNGPSSNDLERLQQLAALRSQGVLTEEEFAAEKNKILNP